MTNQRKEAVNEFPFYSAIQGTERHLNLDEEFPFSMRKLSFVTKEDAQVPFFFDNFPSREIKKRTGN